MRLLLSVNLGLRNLSEIYFYLLMKHVIEAMPLAVPSTH